jgi:RNA-directed DNA polymerase
VRYADDANIYVRSQRAGERVMASAERFLSQRLKLSLNREKSRVARPWVCDYLGYGMSWHQQPRLRVATMSLSRVRDRLRELLCGARGPQDGERHRADKPRTARLGGLLQAKSEQAAT